MKVITNAMVMCKVWKGGIGYLVVERNKLEKIANMTLWECPTAQIAMAVGLEVSEVEEVQKGEEYKEVLVEQSASYYEDRFGRNKSWDDVEKKALDQLNKLVKIVQDPMKLVNIARLANAAMRRGVGDKTSTLNAPKEGANFVVLTLNQNFVKNLQQVVVNQGGQAIVNDLDGNRCPDLVENGINEQVLAKLEHKTSGILMPSEVDALLGGLPEKMVVELDGLKKHA